MKTTIRPILPALLLSPPASRCKPVRRGVLVRPLSGRALSPATSLYHYAARETARTRSRESLVFTILLLSGGIAISLVFLAL